MKVDYLLRFINSLVNELEKGKECGDESFIIPTSLFEIVKSFIYVEIPSKHFLMTFHKLTNNSFRMVITWKTRNIRSLFPLKVKNDYKSCLIYNIEIALVVHVALVKPDVMQKLDVMNIIMQLNVQNHQNTFEATSTTILHELSFQMLRKVLRPELRSIIYCSLET